jgi:predicted transcriptional regulator of viral defense system
MANSDIIMDYAGRHAFLTADNIVGEFNIKLTTARQLLSRLASGGQLSRVGYGKYTLAKAKEAFPIYVAQPVKDIYNELQSALPFTDFCVYSGTLLEPLQHHISINHVIYVETNRDAVDAVFSRLKKEHEPVYRQPDAKFMNDYVDMTAECIIVKPLVTESPITKVNTVPSPTLEKLLVDILKDSDFDYLHGAEYDYMLENAISQYSISISRLTRYARRRGIQDIIQNKITNITL